MNQFLRFVATVCLAYSVSAITNAAEVAFVASPAELYSAMDAAEKGSIGSVAIDQKYYTEGTNKIQKNQIRGLMQTVWELGNRTTYLYGSPLDMELAEELLGVRAMSECRSSVFLGKLVEERKRDNPVVLCDARDNVSGEGIQNRLRVNNERELRRMCR